MSLTIYHNPHCSKSRATRQMLEDAGQPFETVLYLDDPPGPERLCALADLLGLPVSALVRKGEAEYREATDLPQPGDEKALATWLAAHPKVIQRPIVVDDARGRAVIGRPPGNVRALLE